MNYFQHNASLSLPRVAQRQERISAALESMRKAHDTTRAPKSEHDANKALAERVQS